LVSQADDHAGHLVGAVLPQVRSVPDVVLAERVEHVGLSIFGCVCGLLDRFLRLI